MFNILLPAMGTSSFFSDSFFPKSMYEINGKTMLELVMENYADLNPQNYIFVFGEDDCAKFHIDSSAKILSPVAKVIKLKKKTAGALCTCLMAIPYINNDSELIIANSDQIINVDYREILDYFRTQKFDSGVITFPSIHPRWSYAKIKADEVVEVAEKRPLSKSAIAGFYYFRKGLDFVKAAQQAIIKDSNLEGEFYISASINELILMNKRVGYFDISKEQYNSFYSPAKIKEYERNNETR
jgi:phosphatase/phosphohexomutase